MPDQEERKYHCGWCQYDFVKTVGKSIPKVNLKHSKGKKGIVSSQVNCPRCSNGLKTW